MSKSNPLAIVAVGIMAATAIGISVGLAFLRNLYNEPDHKDANAERATKPNTIISKPGKMTAKERATLEEARTAYADGTITKDEFENLLRRRGWKVF